MSSKGERTFSTSFSDLLSLLIAILVLSSLAILLTPRNSKPRLLGEDSLEYLEFADEIRSGALFQFKNPDELSRGATVRAPGYPLLLALMDIGRGHGSERLLLLHQLVLVTSLCSIFFLLPHGRLRYHGVVFAALSIFLWTEFVNVLSTELTAFGLVLILLSLCSVSPRRYSPRRAFLIFLVASCLTLVRPEFIFIHAAVGIILLTQNRSSKVLLGSLCGSVPLLIWLTINYLRLGAFQVALLSGSAFFVIGSMLGPISPHIFSDQTTHEFARRLSPLTWTATDRELLLSASPGAPHTIFHNYVRNLHNAWEVAGDMELSPRQTDKVLLLYGMSAIKQYPKRYAIHLLACVASLGFDVLLFLVIFLGIWFFNPINSMLRWVWLASFFLHFGHTLVVAITQPLIDRYFLLTQTPFTVLSFASAAVSIVSYFKAKELRNN